MDKRETLNTIIVLAAACLIAFLIFNITWFLWIVLFLSIGGLFESRITTGIAKYWMKFGRALGTFNSKIILTLIFFIILTPLAFFFRLFNKQLVNHFKTNSRTSYFDDVNKSYQKSDFEKLW
ncbi:MAG: SxtJ family membrane protein [Deltaproteobacteria bacterium]|nr:SxtJ family membrane protein [Deltaproteobacteria bacterium]